MDKMDIMVKITEANKAYRAGQPVMSDQDFDDLCDAYKAMATPLEWEHFRDSLHEVAGKVKHPFIMGSLDKLKAEEPADIERWIKQYVGSDTLSVSAKIDGISCRLHYENGKLVSATTRGDGYAGVDITNKVKFVKGVPATVPAAKDGKPWDIRGELVIKTTDFADISGQFVNPRNACAGIINQKDLNPALLGHISFIAYEIMGGQLTKHVQFAGLIPLGFDTAWNTEIGSGITNITESLTNLAKQDFGYPTDGLVLSSVNYKAENKYRPDAQVAFKLNAYRGESILRSIDWGTPSKDGRLGPVGEVDPVFIGGSTIRRVTLNNLDWIRKMDLKIGSKVDIVRSGDVIPKIVGVHNDGSEKDIALPTVCPVCGQTLKVDGPHLRCVYPDCKARKAEEVLAFVIKLGIKRIKANTLEGWHVGNFKDLIAFDPTGKGKMGDHFANELQHKMWEADEVAIFEALPFTDLAEATLDKIITHYGWDLIKRYYDAKGDQQALVNVAQELVAKGLPAGIGSKTMDSFLSQLREAMEDFNLVVKSPRYNGTTNTPTSAPVSAAPVAVATNVSGATNNTTGDTTMNTPKIKSGENGSVCFTGALNSMTRAEASRLAEKAGFAVKLTVSSGLDYLVMADPNSNSTKAQKARRYGTRVISEDEFLMMVS